VRLAAGLGGGEGCRRDFGGRSHEWLAVNGLLRHFTGNYGFHRRLPPGRWEVDNGSELNGDNESSSFLNVFFLL
jgi:hypothetical protein